jgi:tetratricopeptide (TPR) repeat protein
MENLKPNHICTLCNKAFRIDTAGEARCPFCLRMTGVVKTDEGLSRPRRPGAAIPWKWVATAIASSVAVALLAGLLWRFLPALVGEGDEYVRLEEACSQMDLPVPWQGWEILKPAVDSALAGQSGQEAFFALAGLLKAREGIRRLDGETPPEELKTPAKMHGSPGATLTRLEAVSYLLAASRHSGLDVAACVKARSVPLRPLWDRDYALCRLADGAVVAAADPFDGEVSPEGFQPMTGKDFLAHYAGAAAELAPRASDSYRLLTHARTLSDDPDLLFRQGVVKLAHGASEFGIEDMKQAIAAGASPEGYLTIGEASLVLSRPQEALEAYAAVLDHAPDSVPARLGKARSLLALSRTDEAGGLLDELEKQSEKLLGLAAARSLYWRQKGDLKKSVESLKSEIALAPLPTHFARLADLLVQDGRTAEAISTLEAEYAKDRSVEIAGLLADLYISSNRSADGLAFLERALADHPESIELLSLASHVHMEGKAFEKAEKELEKILAVKPEARRAMVRLAVCRLLLEEEGKAPPGSAAAVLDRLKARHPNAELAVADLLSGMGHGAEAERLLEKKVEDQPKNREAWTRLYFLALSGEDKAKAAALRSRALSGLPADEKDPLEDMFDKVDAYFAQQKQEK